MKRISVAVVVLLLMVVSYGVGRHRNHSHPAGSSARESRQVLYWVDPMHPDYKSDHPGVAPDCGMALEPVYAETVGAGASVAPIPAGMIAIDAERQQLFGIRVAAVERSSGTENVRVLGRVLPEDTRVYRINAGMEGFVRETFNDSPGELVKKDQKLAAYYGGDIVAVASGFLAASAGAAAVNGQDGGHTPHTGATSKQPPSNIQAYADRLRNLGMSDAQIQEMAETRRLPESIYIVSPVDGLVLARNITPGQHFDHATEFYRIADLSRVWIEADILGNEAQNFRPGAAVRILLSGGERSLIAHVTDILPQVDPSTRTLKLRLEAENPGYRLRPDMFVDVELPVARPKGLAVPVDAVIDSGREQRVFVERSPGVFEPRDVQVGSRFADRVEIVKGVDEGERVVTAGTFLVDSESRLRSVRSAPKAQPQEKAVPKPKTGMTVRASTVKDAACGMSIDPTKAAAEGNTITRDGITYYFCSDRCKRKFSDQPERYLAANPSGPRS